MKEITSLEVKTYISKGFEKETRQEKGVDGSLRTYTFLTKRNLREERIRNFLSAFFKTLFSLGLALVYKKTKEQWELAFSKKTVVKVKDEAKNEEGKEEIGAKEKGQFVVCNKVNTLVGKLKKEKEKGNAKNLGEENKSSKEHKEKTSEHKKDSKPQKSDEKENPKPEEKKLKNDSKTKKSEPKKEDQRVKETELTNLKSVTYPDGAIPSLSKLTRQEIHEPLRKAGVDRNHQNVSMTMGFSYDQSHIYSANTVAFSSSTKCEDIKKFFIRSIPYAKQVCLNLILTDSASNLNYLNESQTNEFRKKLALILDCFPQAEITLEYDQDAENEKKAISYLVRALDSDLFVRLFAGMNWFAKIVLLRGSSKVYDKEKNLGKALKALSPDQQNYFAELLANDPAANQNLITLISLLTEVKGNAFNLKAYPPKALVPIIMKHKNCSKFVTEMLYSHEIGIKEFLRDCFKEFTQEQAKEVIKEIFEISDEKTRYKKLHEFLEEISENCLIPSEEILSLLFEGRDETEIIAQINAIRPLPILIHNQFLKKLENFEKKPSEEEGNALKGELEKVKNTDKRSLYQFLLRHSKLTESCDLLVRMLPAAREGDCYDDFIAESLRIILRTDRPNLIRTAFSIYFGEYDKYTGGWARGGFRLLLNEINSGGKLAVVLESMSSQAEFLTDEYMFYDKITSNLKEFIKQILNGSTFDYDIRNCPIPSAMVKELFLNLPEGLLKYAYREVVGEAYFEVDNYFHTAKNSAPLKKVISLKELLKNTKNFQDVKFLLLERFPLEFTDTVFHALSEDAEQKNYAALEFLERCFKRSEKAQDFAFLEAGLKAYFNETSAENLWVLNKFFSEGGWPLGRKDTPLQKSKLTAIFKVVAAIDRDQLSRNVLELTVRNTFAKSPQFNLKDIYQIIEEQHPSSYLSAYLAELKPILALLEKLESQKIGVEEVMAWKNEPNCYPAQLKFFLNCLKKEDIRPAFVTLFDIEENKQALAKDLFMEFSEDLNKLKKLLSVYFEKLDQIENEDGEKYLILDALLNGKPLVRKEVLYYLAKNLKSEHEEKVKKSVSALTLDCYKCFIKLDKFEENSVQELLSKYPENYQEIERELLKGYGAEFESIFDTLLEHSEDKEEFVLRCLEEMVERTVSEKNHEFFSNAVKYYFKNLDKISHNQEKALEILTSCLSKLNSSDRIFLSELFTSLVKNTNALSKDNAISTKLLIEQFIRLEFLTEKEIYNLSINSSSLEEQVKAVDPIKFAVYKFIKSELETRDVYEKRGVMHQAQAVLRKNEDRISFEKTLLDLCEPKNYFIIFEFYKDTIDFIPNFFNSIFSRALQTKDRSFLYYGLLAYYRNLMAAKETPEILSYKVLDTNSDQVLEEEVQIKAPLKTAGIYGFVQNMENILEHKRENPELRLSLVIPVTKRIKELKELSGL